MTSTSKKRKKYAYQIILKAIKKVIAYMTVGKDVS